jgi:hypothetical protein
LPERMFFHKAPAMVVNPYCRVASSLLRIYNRQRRGLAKFCPTKPAKWEHRSSLTAIQASLHELIARPSLQTIDPSQWPLVPSKPATGLPL